MQIEAIRQVLFSKDETLGYAQREEALEQFLNGDPPEGKAEKYVAALEYVLERLSTPINDGDVLLGRMVDGPVPYPMEPVPAGGTSHAGNPFRVTGRNTGHMSLDYSVLLTKGLSGLLDEMRRSAQSGEQREYVALMERACAAIKAFAERYAAAARGEGLGRAALALETVPYRPAYDLFSALQSVWFMEMVFSCVIGGRDYGYSRLDLALLPFFEGVSREEALELFTAFLIKNNEIGGIGSELADHVPTPCSATNIYMMLGGRGASDALALDLLLLEAARAVRMPQPVLALRVERESPQEWKVACADAAQTLNGQASIYNDDALIPNLVGLGLTPEQALHYTMSGCNRVEFCGHQSSDTFHNCAQWLLDAFYDEQVTDMDGLLDSFAKAARAGLVGRIGNPRVPASEEMRFNLESLLLKGCVGNARDIENGGLSCETVVHNICGIATIADSLAAIQTLVFEQCAMSLDAFRALVKGNYETDRVLAARIRTRFPKYGNDDPKVDIWAAKAGKILAEEIRKLSGERIHIPSFYALYFHHRFGETTGATPDGRLAGEPLSENQSPVYGRDTQGVTATLHSAAALPQYLCGAGGLNVRFAKPLDNRVLAGLTDAFFSMGGVNITPNVVSRETLLAAREHPDEYASLCVRIVGYSEVFLRMPEAMQLELIQRTEVAL